MKNKYNFLTLLITIAIAKADTDSMVKHCGVIPVYIGQDYVLNFLLQTVDDRHQKIAGAMELGYERPVDPKSCNIEEILRSTIKADAASKIAPHTTPSGAPMQINIIDTDPHVSSSVTLLPITRAEADIIKAGSNKEIHVVDNVYALMDSIHDYDLELQGFESDDEDKDIPEKLRIALKSYFSRESINGRPYTRGTTELSELCLSLEDQDPDSIEFKHKADRNLKALQEHAKTIDLDWHLVASAPFLFDEDAVHVPEPSAPPLHDI